MRTATFALLPSTLAAYATPLLVKFLQELDETRGGPFGSEARIAIAKQRKRIQDEINSRAKNQQPQAQ
jgi:hypothetical protein